MSEIKHTPGPRMVGCKCKRCGKPFQARAVDVKRGWGLFCSKSCKAATHSATKHSESAMPKWLRDDLQFDQDMDDATGGWDEGGWLSDDSGVESVGSQS